MQFFVKYALSASILSPLKNSATSNHQIVNPIYQKMFTLGHSWPFVKQKKNIVTQLVAGAYIVMFINIYDLDLDIRKTCNLGP